MNCPICKKELEIKSKKVGAGANGEVIYNEFAICHDCQKQWNLDKHRAKNAGPAEQPKKGGDESAQDAPKRKKKRPAGTDGTPVKRVPKTEGAEGTAKAVKTSDASKTDAEKVTSFKDGETPRPRKKKRPVNPDGTPITRTPKPEGTDGATRVINTPKAAVTSEEAPRPRKKKRPADPDGKPVAATPKKRPAADGSGSKRPATKKPAPRAMEEPIEEFSDAKEQSYSNIPPKHVREAREKEMRDNYQNMLDEGADEDEGRFPTALVVILVLLILAAAAFAGYWFLLRDTFPLF